MSVTTVHQRVHLWLWNWATGPGWCRDPSAIEWQQLWNDGARVVRIQLQDNGPVWRDLVVGLRQRGWKVWGAVGHVQGRDPVELAVWLNAERKRVGLNGLDCNFEEDVRAMDAASGGMWSTSFTTGARRLMPYLPMHLDTYYGSAAATPGINLRAYRDNGFRLSVQTYWGAEGLYDDPVPRIVQWCAEASPSWPRSIVKPIFRCAPNNSDELPDPTVFIPDAQRAGTIGCVFYYVDGADFGWLRSTIRAAIAAGVAR